MTSGPRNQCASETLAPSGPGPLERKGFDTPPKTPGKSGFLDSSGAKSGALGAREGIADFRLALVIDRWASLSEDTKEAVIRMVERGD